MENGKFIASNQIDPFHPRNIISLELRYITTRTHYSLGKPIEIKKTIAEFQETREGAGEGINQNRSKNGKTGKDNRQFIRKP